MMVSPGWPQHYSVIELKSEIMSSFLMGCALSERFTRAFRKILRLLTSIQRKSILKILPGGQGDFGWSRLGSVLMQTIFCT